MAIGYKPTKIVDRPEFDSEEKICQMIREVILAKNKTVCAEKYGVSLISVRQLALDRMIPFPHRMYVHKNSKKVNSGVCKGCYFRTKSKKETVCNLMCETGLSIKDFGHATHYECFTSGQLPYCHNKVTKKQREGIKIKLYEINHKDVKVYKI